MVELARATRSAPVIGLTRRNGGAGTTGDGFFASFGDAGAALDCADLIQHLAEHRRRHGFAPQVRIGVHAAEATAVADDYAGLGVHEAARVGALAEGGGVVRNDVDGGCRGHARRSR